MIIRSLQSRALLLGPQERDAAGGIESGSGGRQSLSRWIDRVRQAVSQCRQTSTDVSQWQPTLPTLPTGPRNVVSDLWRYPNVLLPSVQGAWFCPVYALARLCFSCVPKAKRHRYKMQGQGRSRTAACSRSSVDECHTNDVNHRVPQGRSSYVHGPREHGKELHVRLLRVSKLPYTSSTVPITVATYPVPREPQSSIGDLLQIWRMLNITTGTGKGHCREAATRDLAAPYTTKLGVHSLDSASFAVFQ
jgi:hypothetical protein